MKAAILYDSSAYLSAPLNNRCDLFQVDFTLVLPNGEIIIESVDESHLENFFDQWLQEGMTQPKTSQPSIQDYHTALQKIIDAGYDTVFGVFLSSSVSGTYQTAQSVSPEYQDQLNIINFDTVGLSVHMEQLIRQLAFMIDAGWSFSDIKESISWLIDQSRFFIALENSDNLIKGGRGDALSGLEKSSFMTRSILKYVPDSTPVLMELFRTNKQRNNSLAQLAMAYQDQHPGDKIQISIGHTHSINKAHRLKAAVQELLLNQKIFISMIGTALCSHLCWGSLSTGSVPAAQGVEVDD